MGDDISRFSRLMRPTFGYIVAISWGVQMLAVAFVILFKTDEAAPIINAMESLSTTWAVGLSVLGIYVYRRRESKKHQDRKDES
jgi:hypothetical protein